MYTIKTSYEVESKIEKLSSKSITVKVKSEITTRSSLGSPSLELKPKTNVQIIQMESSDSELLSSKAWHQEVDLEDTNLVDNWLSRLF